MIDYGSIYQGVQYTTASPTYFTPPISGYQRSLGSIGSALDPRTGNQLGAVNIALNPGVKNIEVQGTMAQSWESVPDPHLDEIRRLAKFGGSNLSLHAPIVEASGIGEGGFTEDKRIASEKQIESAYLRGHRLDPTGNISVTVHSTAELPDLRPHAMITTKEGKREPMEQGLYVVNEESGQINMIKPEKRYFPEPGEEFTGKEIKFQANKELDRRNEEQWTETLSGVNRYAEFGDESLERLRREIQYSRPEARRGEISKKEMNEVIYNISEKMAEGGDALEKFKKQGDEFREIFDEAEKLITHSQIYYRDSYRNMKSLFDKAWNNTKSEKDKEKLKEFANWARPFVEEGKIQTDPGKLKQLGQVVTRGLKTLNELDDTPKMWQPLDEFAIKKSAQTFANVAESGFNKFGQTAPILNIENAPANQGLSSGEDLKKLVQKSREQLVKNLQDHKGMSKSVAENTAKKLIGATWDVGHINMLKKKGYTDKEIVKQTEIIAPFVKHVHLSDNFGMDHTELPMGMGTVPLKEMMDKLKKVGYKGKEIIEAGNWWQFFAEHGGGNPFKPSIEAFNSPVYAMAYGPGWSQSGGFGAYYGGGGPINPSVHHNLYGSGFQNMPVELGGEIPGDRGRFAGNPNQ
ncbi:MAG: TIM barrel protein [archaeon]